MPAVVTVALTHLLFTGCTRPLRSYVRVLTSQLRYGKGGQSHFNALPSLGRGAFLPGVGWAQRAGRGGAINRQVSMMDLEIFQAGGFASYTHHCRCNGGDGRVVS